MQTDLNSHLLHLVTNSKALKECCSRLSEQNRLALDTEFERSGTFYPKPGLIQLADDQDIYLIDPVAINDLSSFSELLQTESITWVMHACGEDLSLLFSKFGKLPENVFDTQLAAAYSGFGFSLSYQTIVDQLLSVRVAKNETRSDWLQRPLTDSQLQYAAIDVQYLLALHQKYLDMLTESGALLWLMEDLRALNLSVQLAEDELYWRGLFADISNSWRLSSRGLLLLQALCVWREEEARRRNRPRNWIAKDNELFAIAETFSNKHEITEKAMGQIDSLPGGLIKKHGRSLVEKLNSIPKDTSVDRSRLNPPLHSRYRDVMKIWRQIILAKAEELNIAPELLARKKWLVDLVRGFEQSGKLEWQPPLTGWRKELLQDAFEEVLPGSQLG